MIILFAGYKKGAYYTNNGANCIIDTFDTIEDAQSYIDANIKDECWDWYQVYDADNNIIEIDKIVDDE